MFSIPVHEKLEVVVDQICNFISLNTDCGIVLHFSQDFNYVDSSINREEFNYIIKKIGNIYINPESVRTGPYDIIQSHISNYKYVKKITNFQYYCMCASNELFIKPGLYDYIRDYDCGVDMTNNTDTNTIWKAGKFAHRDASLKNILSEIGGDGKIMGSQVEGTFYSEELFNIICGLIERHYDWLNMQEPYAREEVYFSTIIWNLKSTSKNIRVSNQGMFTWCPWNRKYTMNVRLHEVKRLIEAESNIYSVKRVERNNNDCIRAYIRQKFGYIVNERELIGSIPDFSNYELQKSEILKEFRLHANISKKGFKKVMQKLQN